MKKMPERLLRISQGRDEIGELRSLARSIPDVIDLGYGDIDFNTPEHIKNAAKKAIDENFTKYTAGQGIPELRYAIAEKLSKENGIDVNSNTEITLVAGGMEGIYTLMQALIDVGDEVIIANPCYMPYKKAIRYSGGLPVSVYVKEKRDFRIDPLDIERKVTSRTRAILLVSPDNPTGSVLTRNDLEAIAEIAKKYRLLVISDEIYEKFVYDGEKHLSIASFPGMKEHTITLNGFSKAYAMTGWRLGYIVADEAIMEPIIKVHNMIFPLCSITQRAGLAAMTGPQDSMKEMIREYQTRKDLAVDELNKTEGITCYNSRGAIYVYPKISALEMSSHEFSMHLLKEAKVLTYPGTAFGDGGEGYLRMSLAASRKDIKAGIRKIRGYAKK